VQGLVAAFDWDAAAATGDLLTPAAAIASADVVVSRVAPSYMVLGVVVDNDGQGANFIPPDDDILLATATLKCKSLETTTDIQFQDGLYATVDGGPVLENIVVVGGLSIGKIEGLKLTDGQLECFGIRNQFSIDPASPDEQAKVLMDAKADVEGYVVALCSDPGELTVLSVAKGADASAADFEAAQVFANGGTLGVVMDLTAPYTNAVIAAGEKKHIATFQYKCVQGDGERNVRFCNNELGDPLKENVMVQGGMSMDPFLVDGKVGCPPTCVPVPEGPPGAATCTDGKDNDCDGKVDAGDTDCQIPAGQAFLCGGRPGATGYPTQAEQSLGLTEEICFYINNPEDNAEGSIPQFDHIQGFSMALTYCCDIEVVTEKLDISGTILEAIGAEYVNVQADNNANDGDACELIIGVLVDALPPFDMATIPPAPEPQLMGCVTFRVKDTAPCGPCCPIEFTDGVNGRGKVPINNLVSVENNSSLIPMSSRFNCSLCVVDKPCFFRGDCNFSGNSGSDGSLAVDVSDAAAVVSFLFAPGPYKFAPRCLDACDCNDDGRIDLADAVCILRYLFQQGPFPPLPGPGFEETGEPNPDNVKPTACGEDPVFPGVPEDLLDCEGGTRC
jgi:hypothetical protein